MTTWSPNLKGRDGPRYLAIADTLAEDVGAGRLKPGARLPTHRDLAGALGVTVGTVTRAYAEAHRRGLVRGEVGRGTFVGRGSEDSIPFGAAAGDDGSLIDLSLNFPVGEGEDTALAATLSRLAGRDGLAGVLDYQPHAGTARHRAAGAAWVARVGVEAPADQVLVCSGGQHAMAVVFSTLAKPGDVVLTESLTYPGMRTLAALLHLRLQGLAMDDKGIRPEAFAAACRGRAPRLLYCVPTIHNPTGAVMPESRRREIAAIAKAHNVLIVEDDTYGCLPPERPLPLWALAPEVTLYIAGLSKSVAPGLRIAYLVAPKRLYEQLVPGIRSTTWMAAPLMAEIAAAWIDDGTADLLLKRKRKEATERQALARKVLGRRTAVGHPHSYHLWLRLSAPWTSESFTAEARRSGVAVTPGEAFAVGGGAPPGAVRVCLGAVRSRARLEKGLRVLAEVLAGAPPRRDLSIV
jgi:DNA-binding transcriptional MocR family regulator